MESVIKKIFDGKKDQMVHDEFIKYSRGVFKNKYLIDAKKQSDKWNIKTSNEFANFFVRKGLEKASGELEVKGVIVSTFDVRSEAGFEISDIKQFMGIKQAVVDCKVDPKKIIDLMERQPRAFYALSFKLNDYELKIKAKAPKSAKPSNKGDAEIKADFCSLKTGDISIVNDLFFDNLDFSSISINHTIQIDNIELPKGVSDPVLMREKAIRKGKIIRKIVLDGSTKNFEKSFEA
jgi:hypothetical protein